MRTCGDTQEGRERAVRQVRCRETGHYRQVIE